MIIEASAVGYFKLQVDHLKEVVEGKGINNVRIGEVKGKKCKTHVLIIESEIEKNNTSAGIIYQVTQDLRCMDCPVGTYFNRENC